MSRSNKGSSSSASPIKRYISYSGSTGKFNYWDKDKEERVDLDTLDIVVLDVKASISGFNESLGARISSNMVTSIGKEPFKVICFSNGKALVQSEGLYKDIKDEIRGYGGKFTTNVLAVADVGYGSEVVNVQLSGGALGNWIDFGKDLEGGDIYDHQITFKQGILSKREKGKSVPVTKKEEDKLEAEFKKNPRFRAPIWFYTVAFDTSGLTEEQGEEADVQDKVLQKFFASKLESTKAAPELVAEPEADDSDDNEDLPF